MMMPCKYLKGKKILRGRLLRQYRKLLKTNGVKENATFVQYQEVKNIQLHLRMKI